MKVVLLENLLISGKRYTAGEEIEVDETVGLQLLKENLALVGVNEVEDAPVEKLHCRRRKLLLLRFPKQKMSQRLKSSNLSSVARRRRWRDECLQGFRCC